MPNVWMLTYAETFRIYCFKQQNKSEIRFVGMSLVEALDMKQYAISPDSEDHLSEISEPVLFF